MSVGMHVFSCAGCGEVVDAGHKCDKGKLEWYLMPFDVLRGVVRVLMHGAQKYSAHNWRAGMAWSRPYSATIRHLDAFWAGENLDPDSGEHHLDHAICELLFLRYYVDGDPKLDDRYRPVPPAQPEPIKKDAAYRPRVLPTQPEPMSYP